MLTLAHLLKPHLTIYQSVWRSLSIPFCFHSIPTSSTIPILPQGVRQQAAALKLQDPVPDLTDATAVFAACCPLHAVLSEGKPTSSPPDDFTARLSPHFSCSPSHCGPLPYPDIYCWTSHCPKVGS